ncbi:hypothetical protein [Streptomyces phaeofaciens]|uniref:hypothetical protein n=1 Tax=Streptomyces phaeofaciens TaxID=68254 RepID=UPI00369A01BF
MLQEKPPYYEIDGKLILGDHADPRQFYYMPLAPRFVTRTDGGLEVPAFQLVKFRSDTRGGGLADFDVHLGMTSDELSATTDALKSLAGLARTPLLAPLPVIDGSVSLLLFGQDAGGGAGLVRTARHAARPCLFGDNRAAFSVELDERGTTVLDKAMRGELSPLGVVYSLDYLALRPAYHVRLSIDWDRVQEILDASFGHEGLIDSVQIQDMMERLEEQRAIVYQVDTFIPEDDDTGTFAQRRDAAAARARDMITDAFFESSLDPLHRPPDGWDRARDVIKSFAPNRSTPTGVFTYRKTHHTRVDRKRLDVDLSERTTVRRTIYPQGHLDGLFEVFGTGLDPDRLILEVDADDPWFERRRLKVVSQADFVRDPVRSLTASLSYGGTVQSVRLDPQHTDGEVIWPSTVRDGAMIQPVDLVFTVDLVPADGGERPGRLVSEPAEVLGGVAALEPRELFSLETIPVLTRPGFPFDRYPRVDVRLRYDDPAHRVRQDDLIRLSAQQPQAEWQRFLVGEPAGPASVEITYRGADHRDHVQPSAPLNGPQVDVRDPFPDRRRVDVFAVLNFDEVDRAFVDLSYDDAAHNIHVEKALELTREFPTRPFIVDLVDPRAALVRYRITLLMRDATVFEGPWSTTLRPRIIVRADLRGHRSVTLRSPADFAAEGLERIQVQARAQDPLAGLSFADAFDFTAAGMSGVFEFDFADPARDSYELRIRRFFRNGLSDDQDWRRFDDDLVTVPATT